MESNADKGKYKIKQSEQKQESVSKLYIGSLKPSIKENDLEELFGLKRKY